MTVDQLSYHIHLPEYHKSYAVLKGHLKGLQKQERLVTLVDFHYALKGIPYNLMVIQCLFLFQISLGLQLLLMDIKSFIFMAIIFLNLLEYIFYKGVSSRSLHLAARLLFGCGSFVFIG